CSLLTQAHTGLPKGEAALDLEMLQGAHLSLTAALPVQTGPQKAALEPWLRHLSELFTGRGYIGCFRRFDGNDAERLTCATAWSRLTGFPIVATSRPLYHDKSRRPLADIVQCIREGLTLDSAGTRLDCNAEAYLRTEAALRRCF